MKKNSSNNCENDGLITNFKKQIAKSKNNCFNFFDSILALGPSGNHNTKDARNIGSRGYDIALIFDTLWDYIEEKTRSVFCNNIKQIKEGNNDNLKYYAIDIVKVVLIN